MVEIIHKEKQLVMSTSLCGRIPKGLRVVARLPLVAGFLVR
jgi:hypothetical protein